MEAGRETQILRGRRVQEVVSGMYTAVTPATSIAEAEALQLKSREPELLLVDDAGMLLGQVTVFAIVEAVRAGHAGRPVATIAGTPGLILYDDMDLLEAMQSLRNFVGVSVPGGRE